MIFEPRRAALAVLVCVGAMSGCAPSQEDPVRTVVDDFYGAVASDDGAGACATLAPATRSELEESSGMPCDQAVLEEDVPQVVAPTDVQVFGTEAQVQYSGETAFLTRFADGWRVVSAVCTRAANRYDCKIKGA